MYILCKHDFLNNFIYIYYNTEHIYSHLALSYE